jgi:hypothetical protein
MENMKLKVEHAPKRCDICHQTDFFDASKNNCLRCSELTEYHSSNGAISSKRNNLMKAIRQEDRQASFVLLEFIKQNELVFGLFISSPYVILTMILFIVTYMLGTLVALPIALAAVIFLLYMAKTMRNIKNNLKRCKRCSEHNSINNNHCFNCGSPLTFAKA